MAVLGLRPSECVALRVGDLDLDKEVLYVRRAAVDVPGKGMVERDETKTGNPRTIPLMGTEQAFKDHLSFRYDINFWVEEMGPRRIPHKDDLLFESPRNGTRRLGRIVKRSIVVETASGVVTSMSWWSSMVVEGTTVVMTSPNHQSAEACDLVVAELHSKEEAQAFFRTLIQNSDYGVRTYRASGWPGGLHPPDKAESPDRPAR